MIIDIHTHTFPDDIAAAVIDKLSRTSHIAAFTDGTIKALIKSMNDSGVDKSVILPVATNTHQVEKVNNASIEINEKYFDEGIISFACIHPDYDKYSQELSRIKNYGFKGIKIHPVYQNTDIDDIKYLRIFDRAAELNLIVIAHAGLDIGFPEIVRCSPKMSRHAVDEVGNFKFVLAHMGGWKNWDEVSNYLADTKVYIDTAFSTGMIKPRIDSHWEPEDLKMLNEDEFMVLVKNFGANRVIFGTDSPWSSQSESIEFIKKLSITEDEKFRILGGNAAKLLNL